ncbi:MAG: ABC transporter ATP-binding protein [bacterium]|nr:ABC transporter ATP-binding protein [bacterium]
MIKITDLWKAFEDHQVLKGVNLHIRQNEVMVIIGQSGCGKSVLLKLIIELLKPDRGRIEIFGQDITRLKGEALHKIQMRTGMVFQGSALFDSLTIGQNVGFFLYEHTDLDETTISGIVKEKLALVGLEGIENKKPSELSGGMKKRVALARVIAYEPEIIFYDEPTTGIDPIRGSGINRLIKKLQEKFSLTSVVVTHDMVSAYQIADRIAMLYDGRIIEVGTPDQIRQTKDPVVRQFITGEANGPIQ